MHSHQIGQAFLCKRITAPLRSLTAEGDGRCILPRMGLLFSYTATEIASRPEDAAALRDVLSAMGSVDGDVDATERRVIEALFHTIPQLRDHAAAAPPRSNRAAILTALGKLTDERLRRQCFVLAVELAIASDGVNPAEEQYLESLKAALRIDDAFAVAAFQVMACKYARAAE